MTEEGSSEEAREAGRKGGRAVSQNRNHMSAIGHTGGESRAPSFPRAESERRDRPAANDEEQATSEG